MPASSTESLPATLLVIPLADTSPARWLHFLIVFSLILQTVLLLPAEPLAATVTFAASALVLWSLWQTSQAVGKLYLTDDGWCLVDGAGMRWRAPLHAVSMVSFACSISVRNGTCCRWLFVTRGVCGTVQWRALRLAVTLYARPARLKDRVLSCLESFREVQREVQPAALPPLKRTANHQLGHH